MPKRSARKRKNPLLKHNFGDPLSIGVLLGMLAAKSTPMDRHQTRAEFNASVRRVSRVLRKNRAR